jgi:hypothetical protein
VVRPGGNTSVTSPDESLIWTRSGTLVNVTVMSPDWSVTVRTWLATSLPVTSPESSMITARDPDSVVTEISPDWSLIVGVPEIRVAVMFPEESWSVTALARPLAVRSPDVAKTLARVPAGTATA